MNPHATNVHLCDVPADELHGRRVALILDGETSDLGTVSEIIGVIGKVCIYWDDFPTWQHQEAYITGSPNIHVLPEEEK